MAILIETTDDFIRALRENEEFLAAARREIATQDLIELPAKFAKYTASADKRMDSIDERIAVLAANTEAMNRRMDGMSTDIRFIREAHRTEHRDMHRFRGNYAIEAARNSEWDIAELFADARGARRFRLRTLTHEERDDMFDDNADAIDLLDTEGNISKSFPSGDIIAEVRQRNSNRTPVLHSRGSILHGRAKRCDSRKRQREDSARRHGTRRLRGRRRSKSKSKTR